MKASDYFEVYFAEMMCFKLRKMDFATAVLCGSCISYVSFALFDMMNLVS